MTVKHKKKKIKFIIYIKLIINNCKLIINIKDYLSMTKIMFIQEIKNPKHNLMIKIINLFIKLIYIIKENNNRQSNK